MNRDALLNVLGRTLYLDDLPELKGLLHASVLVSESARGRLLGIDARRALELDPRIRVITAGDIPGENQLNYDFKDESLLVDSEWSYSGEPLALVLAPSKRLAKKARDLIRVEGEELPPLLDARDAAARGNFIFPPRTMRSGDAEKAFAECAFVAAGRIESGSQEHVYLETQGALAQVTEGGGIRVISGTQSPSQVQKAVARTLGLPMNLVEVEAMRLGGAFGGKEDQAAPWAALAALGAKLTGNPVKLVLGRREDMRYTGKRHPYSTDFRIGLSREGKILAFEADYYQNGGACADLSPGILSRTLFHAMGAYFIPNVRITGYSCRTNLPPFTAFRGFGAPQAFFVIESAIAKASEVSGIPVRAIQEMNLLRDGDSFHFGQEVLDSRSDRCWKRLDEKYRLEELESRIADFNESHRLEKRGLAIIPVCFGISFTKFSLNQAGALIHVYQDGSVSVNLAAVEMGQGVYKKIVTVVAKNLGIPEEWVKTETTRTGRVANTAPTAASTGTDLNGMAALDACGQILGRFLDFAAEKTGIAKGELKFENGALLGKGVPTGLEWKGLVGMALEARVDLSAHGYHASPGLVYDAGTEKGSPFVYHVYGAAIVTATVDGIRGRYRIDEALIVHDAGEPIDPLIDLGQAEGAFAQGLGWSVLEDLRYGPDGRLLTDTLATYKVPDIHFIPPRLEVEFLKDAPNPKAVMNSKAIGEPPLIYGIGGYFAVLNALKEFRKGSHGFYNLPMTPEKALDFLDGTCR